MEQIPSIGRVVHVITPSDPHCSAATVTAVIPDEHGTVSPRARISVFIMTTLVHYHLNDIPHSSAHVPYSWHWPEFVAPR